MKEIDSTTAAITLDDPESLTGLLAGTTLHTDTSLASQIHSLLLDLIVSLKLQPGQLVSEKEVAESLNASKTPVREALIRLEDSRLVKIIPKSGTYVTPISISAYIEGCFTRLQLESGAVRRAASKSDSRSKEMLDAIIDQQAEALKKKQYEAFFALDQALHESFFEIAGIRGVWSVLSRTQADVNRIRHLKRINKIQRGPQVLAQHRNIVKAILSRDPDAAEQALLEHIGSLEQEIEQLTSNPQLLEFIEQQDKGQGRKRNPRKSVLAKTHRINS